MDKRPAAARPGRHRRRLSRAAARRLEAIGLLIGLGAGLLVALGRGAHYWLIQADPLVGSNDIDAYPAAEPWGPFDSANSLGVTTGCVPMSVFTNTVTLPRFITVPLALLGGGSSGPAAAVRAGASGYPHVVPQDPTQWFDEWDFPGGCRPVPGLASLRARPRPGAVVLSWPPRPWPPAFTTRLRSRPGRSSRSGRSPRWPSPGAADC